MLAPVMRWMLPDAKNSGIGTVPAITPMNWSVSCWLPRRAAIRRLICGVGGSSAARWQVSSYIAAAASSRCRW